MTTTINKTNGTVLTTVADGSADVSATDLYLIGKLYRNYGELVNENFVKLLENFANSSAPRQPIVGQLWYDTTNKKLNLFKTSGFVSLATMRTSAAEPTAATVGDLWWDTVDRQLKLYTSNEWIVIAPGYTQSQGKSGAIVETIRDSQLSSHVITKIYHSGAVIATFSNDNEYTPNTSINGFTTIKKGITLSNLSGVKIHGIATEAETVTGGVLGSQLISSEGDSTINGTFTINDVLPLVLGPNGDLSVTVDGSTVNVNKTNAGNIDIRNYNNVTIARFAENLQVAGNNGSAATPTYTFILDNNSGMYLDAVGTLGLSAGGKANFKMSADQLLLNATTFSESIIPLADDGYDLGSISSKYSNVYARTLNGTAVEALYADLAEKYTSDKDYPVGTIMSVCEHEDHETCPCSVNTIPVGVVSAEPAYLMNAGAEGQALALKGRVPVRVIGPVKKGQGIYVNNNGLGSVNVNAHLVGVALESNDSPDEKLVECVLKV